MRIYIDLMHERSRNLVHKRVGSKEVRLDARAVMDEVAECEPQKTYLLSFRLVGDRIAPSNLAPKSIKQGTLLIEMTWPTKSSGCARGLVWIDHDHLKRVGQILILTGEPTKAGGWIWKFTCPLSRRQVQVLYLDLGSERFVSRHAIEKKLPERRPRTRRLWRNWKEACETKAEFCLDGPGAQTAGGRTIIETFNKTIALTARLFYYRENHLPKVTIINVGYASLMATLKKRRARANPAWPYYRDKSGALRMKAKFKKKSGLLTGILKKTRPRQKMQIDD